MVFKLKNTFLVPVSPLKTACFLKTPILNNYLWLVFESVQYFSHFMLFGFYNYFFSFPCFGVTSKCHILLVTKWFFVILWNIDLHTGCLISEPFFTTWWKITFEIRLWNIRRHLIVKTAKTSVILFCQPTFCWCFYFYDVCSPVCNANCDSSNCAAQLWTTFRTFGKFVRKWRHEGDIEDS